MKPVMWLLSALIILSPAPLAAEPGPALPGWMAGGWIETKGDSWTEEYWTPPRGGLMIGMGRNGTGDKLSGWESARIRLDETGKPVFIASPEGGPPTSFAMESSSAEAISFVNPGHDYPQRVRYWREDDALLAEISLTDGSKPMRWRYQRAGQ